MRAASYPQAIRITRRINVINHQIKCEAIEVRTDSGICPGMAQTHQGETFTFGARTPEETGICTNAFNAIYPMALAMRLTDKMDWEQKDYFDITCPHGRVTFRISRIREMG
jgi:uncharacterized repeat protein (TIGR04076 family)